MILDKLTRERKIELEKKLKELKEPKLITSFYREINLLGYRESRYLIDDIGINEVLDFGDAAVQHKIFEKLRIIEEILDEVIFLFHREALAPAKAPMHAGKNGKE